MPERLDAATMAIRVAREFDDGAVVNLGIGLPLLCSGYIPHDHEVLFHSEQGIVGFGPFVTDPDKVDQWLISAGGQPVTALPGMAVMSHDESFAMIRGGHIDISVLGALQVAANGDLANTQMPGRVIGNLGGAQDLATRAKRVIVMMYHTTPDGTPKILSRCTLTVTARACVDTLVTDIAVMHPRGDAMLVREIAPGWGLADVQAITGARLIADPGLCEYALV